MWLVGQLIDVTKNLVEAPDPYLHLPYLNLKANPLLVMVAVIVVAVFLVWLIRRTIQSVQKMEDRKKKYIFGNYVFPFTWILVINIIGSIVQLLVISPIDLKWDVLYILCLFALSVFVTFIYLFYYDLYKISEQAETTREIVERAHTLSQTVYNLFDQAVETLVRYRDRLVEGFFDRFRSTDSASLRDKEICLMVYGQKLEEICGQLSTQELYLRRDRFQVVWDTLTADVEYRSVCDLSAYSTLRQSAGQHFDEFYDGLSQSWERRIRHELTTLEKRTGKFQKVLVYSPPVKCRDKKHRPPCYGPEKKCDYVECAKEEKCIVKSIASQWAEAAVTLRKQRPPAVHGVDKSVSLVLREKIEQRVRNLNRGYEQSGSEHHRLESIDIGLFGGSFVGEEFKVPAELESQQHLMKDYLYRIRYKPAFVSDLQVLFDETVTNDAINVA